VPTCGKFNGNPDLYGLGIRVGVYLQWFSTWLSISFEPESAQETHDVSSIFVFAIIIAIIQAAASGGIRPVEAFIMIQICFGSLSWSGVLWRTIIAGMVASCNLWLWYSGLQTLPSGESCDAFVFMFLRQKLRGSMVVFLRAMGIMYAVVVYSLLYYLGLIALR